MDNIASVPALVPAPGGAILALADNTCRNVDAAEARALFRSGAVMVAHAGFVAGRLRTAQSQPLFDLLELFAFGRPGVPCVPSPLGLALALGLPPQTTAAGQARVLRQSAALLVDELRSKSHAERASLRPLAALLARAAWRWGGIVLEATGEPEGAVSSMSGLEAWRGLSEWEDDAPPAKPTSFPVTGSEARHRLSQLVGSAGEVRPEQVAYAEAATYTFGPRECAGSPKVALIEAGTGVGKTLGYLAPASLWAEKNGAGLWLSTYTRNLQRQIMQELARLYPDPAEREEKVVMRK